MLKEQTHENPFSERVISRYRKKIMARSSALTTISLSLGEPADVVDACHAARSMCASLGFPFDRQNDLARTLAVVGGTLVGAGGRGGVLIADASDPGSIRVRLSINAQSVPYATLHAALERAASVRRRVPGERIPNGPLFWSIEPHRRDRHNLIVVSLVRPR